MWALGRSQRWTGGDQMMIGSGRTFGAVNFGVNFKTDFFPNSNLFRFFLAGPGGDRADPPFFWENRHPIGKKKRKNHKTAKRMIENGW